MLVLAASRPTIKNVSFSSTTETAIFVGIADKGDECLGFELSGGNGGVYSILPLLWVSVLVMASSGAG